VISFRRQNGEDDDEAVVPQIPRSFQALQTEKPKEPKMVVPFLAPKHMRQRMSTRLNTMLTLSVKKDPEKKDRLQRIEDTKTRSQAKEAEQNKAIEDLKKQLENFKVTLTQLESQ
jgi:hypothetical protein